MRPTVTLSPKCHTGGFRGALQGPLKPPLSTRNPSSARVRYSHSKAYPCNLAGPLIPHPAVPYLTSRRSISLASKARTPRILLTPLPSQYADVNLDTAVSVVRIPPVWLQRRAPLHDPVFYIGGLSMPLPVLLQIANHGPNMPVPINFPPFSEITALGLYLDLPSHGLLGSSFERFGAQSRGQANTAPNFAYKSAHSLPWGPHLFNPATFTTIFFHNDLPHYIYPRALPHADCVRPATDMR